MRTTLFIFVMIIFFSACEATKKSTDLAAQNDPKIEVDTIKIENDELEYQIIIVEIGFESWLVTQKPRNYYSLLYLETKNMYYVNEWNIRAISPNGYSTDLYSMPINYDPNIKYGMEVNYLLFMYFKFFEQKYNQRLI